jgi:hypothetical protein
MYTNNPPAGAFLGFSTNQAAGKHDRYAGGETRFDPVEIRRKNALQVGSVTNTGQT